MEIAEAMQHQLDLFVEDCITYSFEPTKEVMELVCTKIADRTDELTYKHLYSQNCKIPTTSQATKGNNKHQTRSNKRQAEGQIPSPAIDSVPNAPPPPTCPLYQVGTCPESTHHVVGGLKALHICANCLSLYQVYKYHPNSHCRSKPRSQGVQLGFPSFHPPSGYTQ